MKLGTLDTLYHHGIGVSVRRIAFLTSMV
jgi:hypothetical protein